MKRMNTQNMDVPGTRAEFERNFNLLHRQMKDGKLHIAQGLIRSLEGLASVRFLPNGRIDFLSVDESSRLLANMTAQFSEDSFQEGLIGNNGSSDVSTVQEDGESPPLASEGTSD